MWGYFRVFLCAVAIGATSYSKLSFANTVEVNHHDWSKLLSLVCSGDLDQIELQVHSDNSIVTIVDKRGNSLLRESIKCKQKSVFDYLLSLNPEYRSAYSDKLYIVHWAATSSDDTYLEALINLGLPVNGTKENTSWKPTPLFYAIGAQKLTNIELLIAAGADINHQNSSGDTPVMYAVNMNFFETAYKILLLGADVTPKNNWKIDLISKVKNSNVDENSQAFYWRKKTIDFILEGHPK